MDDRHRFFRQRLLLFFALFLVVVLSIATFERILPAALEHLLAGRVVDALAVLGSDPYVNGLAKALLLSMVATLFVVEALRAFIRKPMRVDVAHLVCEDERFWRQSGPRPPVALPELAEAPDVLAALERDLARLERKVMRPD